MTAKKIQLFIWVVLLSIPTYAQNAKIEYIAHAAFVIESDNGTRVLIDPYHSYRQMGYTFPDDIQTDFILITHPHYDHDASRYFSENTPTFREPGNYQFKDIHFKGIASQHAFAEQIGKSGNQAYNTIWVVTIGDIQIAHLGDNEVPTPEEVQLLQEVDYIIGPTQDKYQNLFTETTYIPNHYLLPEISKHTNWMQPVNQWLEGKERVARLGSNILPLSSKNNTSNILVFQPSGKVREWPQRYYDALAAINKGFTAFDTSKKPDDGLPYMEKAISLAPFTADGYLYAASFLQQKKNHIAVIELLGKAFASIPDMDWGMEVRIRKMLADAYVATDQKALAYNNYLWIARHERIANKNTMEAAKMFIEGYRKK